MASEGSVTRWIGEIKVGDELAAQQLWDRYFAQLVRLCRKQLGAHPRRVADEEDVALNAFASFCEGAQEGRFPKLHDRDNLWRLLVVIAARKAVDQVQHERRQKRGGGRVQGESGDDMGPDSAHHRRLEQLIGDEPTPEFAAMFTEQYQRLLRLLPDDVCRDIAQLKMEGYTDTEIADRLNCCRSTIQRRLALVRRIWSEQSLGNA